MAIPKIPQLEKKLNAFTVRPETTETSLSRMINQESSGITKTTTPGFIRKYPNIAKRMEFPVGEGLNELQKATAEQTLQKEFQLGREETASGAIPRYEFNLGKSFEAQKALLKKKNLNPEEQNLATEMTANIRNAMINSAMGYGGLKRDVMGGLTKGITKEVPIFAGFKDLTTKFLNYAKGKSTLSKQEILDFARRPELKRGEADLLNAKTKEVTGKSVPAQEFADSLRRDLLELKPVKVKEPQYGGTTLREPALAGSTRKGPGKNYEEVVFESPITTNGSSHYPNSKNYFAHARGDEVVEPVWGAITEKREVKTVTDNLGNKKYELFTDGKLIKTTTRQSEAQGHELSNSQIKKYNKIWREQEIQSDALQKEGLERAKPDIVERVKVGNREFEVVRNRFGVDESTPKKFSEFKMDDPVSKTDLASGNGVGVTALDGGKMTREEAMQAAKEAQKVLDSKSTELEKLQPFANDRFGERIMRERIKEKANKGYEKYRLPTGETIGRIEGVGAENNWYRYSGGEQRIQSRVTLENMNIGDEVFQAEQPNASLVVKKLGEGRFQAVPTTIFEKFPNIPKDEIISFIKNCL